MKTENRVAWTEGMFLRPQHFQQADRWTERLVRDRTEPLVPYPWGLTHLALDRTALGVGRVALNAVAGVMPDGTPFSAPDQADLPAPVQLVEGSGATTIYLALPMAQAGLPGFAPAEAPATARHVRSDYDAADSNADTEFTAPIAVGRHALTLKTDAEAREGYECLPLLRVAETRADLSVILEEEMVPPVLTFGAAPRLRGYLTELLGLLRHRSGAISRRMGDPSIRGGAEFGDYMMLQALNRATPQIAHMEAHAAQLHPETVYRMLAELAGELATFTASDSLAPTLAAYTHMAPEATFGALMEELRRSLSAVLDQSATPIPLEERRHGVRVGMIADAALKQEAGMVIAARSEIPQEQLRRVLPNQIKVGPVDRIAELVNVALPGVPVRPLPVAPRQLPYRARTVYFELDTQDALWRATSDSGAVAIHMAADVPGIEMELWGVRA